MEKRIIWVFGESATGKLTLINNLYNKDNDTLTIFSMNDKKIDVCDVTLEDRNVTNVIEDNNTYDDSLMEEDNLYFNKEKTLLRRSHIMYDVDNFIRSDNDVLLIKGQVLDLNIKRGNILANFLNKYYGTENVKIEAFILYVSDEGELRKRIASKPWFKEMDDQEEKERLLKVIPLKQEQHKDEVLNALSNYDISIYQVESLNVSYRIDNINKNDTLVDIIIPVYNTPIEDLKRCLDSVENQTFKNYKVYIIDDGSDELTKEYLDSCTQNKKNFIAKHIENCGVSNARNIGINISNSKYITFVDADDTVEKDFIKEAYELIENNNLDIIIGGYNEIRNGNIDRVRVSETGLHIYENNTIDNFLEKLLSAKTNENNKEIGDCPTGRIYTRLFKRESLGNLRFDPNVHMSEDTLFMIDYTNIVNRIGIVDKVWYNYYINDYSISNGGNNEKMINGINEFLTEVEKRMNNEPKENIKEAYQARIDRATNLINRVKKH